VNFAGTGRAPAGVDTHVTADGPAQQRQRLLERPDAGLPFRIVRGAGHQHANAPHPFALLRTRRDRPRDRRTAKECDEFASFHRITSRQARRS
jgi:hypothetical protein